MAKIESLEQKRAKLAWEFVKTVKDNWKDKQKDFKSVMRKLPAMILTSGLAQTVAFHLSKGKEKPQFEIIKNLSEALKNLTEIAINPENPQSLITEIKRADHETYILLSREALKYATWLKRFAEAELEE